MQVCVFNLVDLCQECLRQHNEKQEEQESGDGDEASGAAGAETVGRGDSLADPTVTQLPDIPLSSTLRDLYFAQTTCCTANLAQCIHVR